MTDDFISKTRARRTRSRDRQAGTANGWNLFHQSHVGAIIMTVVLWLSATALLHLDTLLDHRYEAAALFPLSGDAVFLLVSLIACGLCLSMVRPGSLTSNSKILLLAVLSLFSLLLAKGVLSVTVDAGLMTAAVASFLLPFAVPILLTTLLLDSVTAVIVGIWTSLVMSMMMPSSMDLWIAGIIASILGAQYAKGLRTRAKMVRVGIVIGLSEIACVFAMTARNWQEADISTVLHQGGACLVSGFISAGIVMLALPVFETLFRVTSNITLLELSDLGHPLLQRLALEAPGTYHHSLVTANLAEAAARDIGANPLLARVCAYYHDVGKLTKPEFFAENIRTSDPHDDLAPSMSTLIIVSHVKEGISLAMHHKLPAAVIDVIHSHHGTSLVSFFHHKARQQLEFQLQNSDTSTPAVNDLDFRYPGPKPVTPESVIVSLSDSVEAASRTLNKVNPTSIDEMVRSITSDRITDGQLENAEVTMAQLTQIQQSLASSLTSMFHARIRYPKDEDHNSQPAESRPGEPGNSANAG